MRCCDCCEEGIDSYNVDDLLDQINALIRKATNGGASKYGLIALDDLNRIRATIRRGDFTEADYLFESAILTDWEEKEECRKRYLKAIAPPPSRPKVGLWQHEVAA